jgi:hypothetical protein
VTFFLGIGETSGLSGRNDPMAIILAGDGAIQDGFVMRTARSQRNGERAWPVVAGGTAGGSAARSAVRREK